jgi:citrate lyase subunit beta/citryl-CoA lyase
MTEPRRLRRSLLFVPGSTPERIAKAIATATDGVILDLEDAVAAAEKAHARDWVVAALRGVDFRGKERIVRLNPLDSPWGRDELAAVVPARPDALLLPKVGSPGDVQRADAEVSRLEAAAGLAPGGIRFHLLIETAAGVLAVAAVAAASPRTVALLFGAGDLARETRARLGPSRLSELHALSLILLAARAAGLDALDSPCFDLDDPAALEAHARFAAELGYDGKAVIHPAQIEVVHRLFTPSPEAVAEARRIVAAYEEAERRGSGALALDGRFVDTVHVVMARETLTRARLAGVLD